MVLLTWLNATLPLNVLAAAVLNVGVFKGLQGIVQQKKQSFIFTVMTSKGNSMTECITILVMVLYAFGNKTSESKILIRWRTLGSYQMAV